MSRIILDLTANYAKARSMKAIGMTTFPEIGKVADCLEMLDVPLPQPGKREVVIKLAASSMHIDEIYVAQGTALGRFFGPKVVSETEPYLLGTSVSGIIVAIGETVNDFKVGDEVIAIPNEYGESASWSTYRCIETKWIMLKPNQLTHIEAAAITMASCVSWAALSFGNVKAGDRCVVVGASGSIGSMMLMYLKSMNCHVTAVCSGKNINSVLSKGADSAVDYTKENFADEAERSGILYDSVFDSVGGRDIEHDAFRVLKNTGAFVTIVGPLKYIGEQKLSWYAVLKVMGYIFKRVLFTYFFRPRYIFGAKFPRNTIKAALEYAVAHKIFMPIERTIPFQIEAITDAVHLLSTHRSRGRIVIDYDTPENTP